MARANELKLLMDKPQSLVDEVRIRGAVSGVNPGNVKRHADAEINALVRPASAKIVTMRGGYYAVKLANHRIVITPLRARFR